MIRLEPWSKVGTRQTVRGRQPGEKALSNERRTADRPTAALCLTSLADKGTDGGLAPFRYRHVARFMSRPERAGGRACAAALRTRGQHPRLRSAHRRGREPVFSEDQVRPL